MDVFNTSAIRINTTKVLKCFHYCAKKHLKILKNSNYRNAFEIISSVSVVDLMSRDNLKTLLGSNSLGCNEQIAFRGKVRNSACKSPLGSNSNFLMLILFFFLIFLSWFYTSIFSGRAAFLHLGAITATLMTANVFFIIIPNQKIVVSDLKAGRIPDPKYGIIAKQRSTHNNYLTLPVIFFMLSNHYPLAFGSELNWVIAPLVFLLGVSIRHYFNTYHATKKKLYWTWIITFFIFALIN